MHITPGKSVLSIEDVPSVDPLSTTMISSGGRV
jgi:hypothetical protein